MWTKGTDALEGELQSSSEVDFYIDQVKRQDGHSKMRYPLDISGTYRLHGKPGNFSWKIKWNASFHLEYF